MLKILDEEYLAEVRAFAAKVGATAALEERLDYLATYGGTPEYTECRIGKDFAPYSFAFVISRNGDYWFNGGLIYSGPTQPLNGSMPALTVGMGVDHSKHGWSVHT